jgi:hypothetical protein
VAQSDVQGRRAYLGGADIDGPRAAEPAVAAAAHRDLRRAAEEGLDLPQDDEAAVQAWVNRWLFDECGYDPRDHLQARVYQAVAGDARAVDELPRVRHEDLARIAPAQLVVSAEAAARVPYPGHASATLPVVTSP